MVTGKRVLVVGAGPAGMVTAYGLAKRGAHVTIIDGESEVVRSPRATVYLPSTLKALAQLDLLEEAKTHGPATYDYKCHFMLTGNSGGFDHRDIADLTPYHYTLNFGQDVLADMILKHFEKLPGAKMRWSTKLESLEQNSELVLATVSTPDGTEVIEADWVVGADGARSTVRKQIGAGFDGFTWPDTFMATNIYFDFSKHGYASANVFSDPEHWAVVAKIDDSGLWRIAYGENSEVSEDERLARVGTRLRHWLPRDASYELSRANSYRVHQRSASTYRVGRVLLAGDAAHATNPLGGMGFTSGIQDAATLIRCLGDVIDGKESADMLDWYAYERRRCFLNIANPTAIETKRRTQEANPQRRLEDEKNFFKMTENREVLRGALMSIFSLESRPYRPDWQTAYAKADSELAASQAVTFIGGTDSTATHSADIH